MADAPTPPPAPAPSAAKIVTQTWRWRQWAIMLSTPVITGILVWQLYSLEPRYWCQVANEAALDRASILQKLGTCIGLQQTILAIKDHAIMGLLAIIGVGYLLFMVTEFRTKLRGTGPGGVSLDIGGEGDGGTGSGGS